MLSVLAGLGVGAVLGGAGVRIATRGVPARWYRGRVERDSDPEGGFRGRLDLRDRSGDDLMARLNRSALDSLTVGVLVLDGDDQLVLVNGAARKLGMIRLAASDEAAATSADPARVGSPGVGVGVGVGEQPNPVVRTLAGQVRRGGWTRTAEIDLPRSRGAGGGRREPSGVNVRVVSLGDGYVAVEAVDVTEAHRLARVRRDFVANVSHELKTPVGALRLLAEALIEATGTAHPTGTEGGVSGGVSGGDEVLDDEDTADMVAVRRFAARIKHESTRLGRLIGDLLELTRLQGAEPIPEPRPVALDNVLTEVIDRTRTPASAKEIEFAVEGARGLVAYGDESQLFTAVSNLAENAVAYSPERTCVRLTTRSDGNAVEVSVADEGIGIAPKDLDRIFERFYRADKARSRVTGGTGLGLAIVKHIATNHGGRVDVVSEVGKGSTFTLRLPALPRDSAFPQPPADEIEPGHIGPGYREARA